MSVTERLLVGLYSGCGADGVDAALVAMRYRRERMRPRLLAHAFCAYPTELRGRVLAAASGEAMPPADLARLDREVAGTFVAAAEAVIAQGGVDRDQIVAVGSSGQEVAQAGWEPDGAGGVSVELGAPAMIAQQLGRPVAAGFAATDLAGGGPGGPVSAWPDWRLMRDKRLSRVLVHLGGIATLTFVGSAAAPEDVIGFDCGPGTMVIDALAQRLFAMATDTDGATASRGRVDGALLNELLADPYFRRGWPKRTGPGPWGRVYAERVLLMAAKRDCGGADLLATTTELTARTVADAVGALTERPHQVVLTGGGALNIHLAGRIRTLLSPSSTVAMDRFGIGVRAKQAVCTAMLAAARVDGFAARCSAPAGPDAPAAMGGLWGARRPGR